jgi:ammonia channel protein AmtB
VFHAPSLGGNGAADYSIITQVGIQGIAVLITIGWIGVVSVVSFLIAKALFGLRVSEEEEREGLDITYHGESAYEFTPAGGSGGGGFAMAGLGSSKAIDADGKADVSQKVAG